jgi:hypothetical protein
MTAELTISEFKKALKAVGLQTVTSELNRYQTRSHRGFIGISGGSIGPMTATTAHLEHNKQAENRLIDKLRSLPGVTISLNQENGLSCTLVTAKKTVTYKFIWQLFRTYAHNEYDPSYLTYWLTMRQV